MERVNPGSYGTNTMERRKKGGEKKSKKRKKRKKRSKLRILWFHELEDESGTPLVFI